MLVPLYGFLAGDTLGLLVLVHSEDRVGAIADRLQMAASVRVAPAFTPRCTSEGGDSIAISRNAGRPCTPRPRGRAARGGRMAFAP